MLSGSLPCCLRYSITSAASRMEDAGNTLKQLKYFKKHRFLQKSYIFLIIYLYLALIFLIIVLNYGNFKKQERPYEM